MVLRSRSCVKGSGFSGLLCGRRKFSEVDSSRVNTRRLVHSGDVGSGATVAVANTKTVPQRLLKPCHLRHSRKTVFVACHNGSGAHPSRRLRRVGYRCSSPEALPRNFSLSHPSQKARRMGHPIRCDRARKTRPYLTQDLKMENPGLKNETWATHSLFSGNFRLLRSCLLLRRVAGS
jgi:hypothetical protein